MIDVISPESFIIRPFSAVSFDCRCLGIWLRDNAAPLLNILKESCFSGERRQVDYLMKNALIRPLACSLLCDIWGSLNFGSSKYLISDSERCQCCGGCSKVVRTTLCRPTRHSFAIKRSLGSSRHHETHKVAQSLWILHSFPFFVNRRAYWRTGQWWISPSQRQSISFSFPLFRIFWEVSSLWLREPSRTGHRWSSSIAHAHFAWSHYFTQWVSLRASLSHAICRTFRRPVHARLSSFLQEYQQLHKNAVRNSWTRCAVVV